MFIRRNNWWKTFEVYFYRSLLSSSVISCVNSSFRPWKLKTILKVDLSSARIIQDWKPTKECIPSVSLVVLYKAVSKLLSLWVKSYIVTLQIRATERFFLLILSFMSLFWLFQWNRSGSIFLWRRLFVPEQYLFWNGIIFLTAFNLDSLTNEN